MKTKDQVIEFLDSLQWNRLTKKELEIKCQEFLETTNKLHDSTCTDCKEFDYSFIFTNGIGACSKHFIDIEIYYLKMRQRNHFLVTGSELLMYEE